MLDYNITYLKGVGEKRARLFNKLGVDSVGALLRYYPRDYIDLSATISPLEAPIDKSCAIKAKVTSDVKKHYIRKNMVLYKFDTVCNDVVVRITVFNNKYIADKIKKGKSYLFYGKITGNLIYKEMSSPEIFDENTCYIRPIYKATDRLPSYQIEKIVKNALEHLDILEDVLPADVIEKENLVDLHTAIKNIHFPQSSSMLQKAKDRLVFEELLILQCGIIYLGSKKNIKSNYIINDYTDQFKKLLPYTLTNAQAKAINECLSDMSSGIQMNRLIQGDVGCGKTVVAAAACYCCVKSGFQATVMVPTEVLAHQHYESFCSLFKNTDINVAILSGSTTAKNKTLVSQGLMDGKIDIVIGTHALIEDNIQFNNLGLIITDEQHRFGVRQRAKLAGKAANPHTLVMSATPIPRTLALLIYGDLDVSIIDELPPGRQKIDTFVVDESYNKRLYDFIKKHLDKGLQAYIVCPLVEDNNSDLISAKKHAEDLQNSVFSDYNVGLLYGKMKSSEKDKVMQDFVDGKTNLLVSTTVIEVGVNIPNAVIMVIENAERFGLSQLHQLRGRVGRDQDKSYCILVSNAKTGSAEKRLNIMKTSNNGFEVADFDLKLRGPGDFFGDRQHGLPQLKIADLYTNMPILSRTKSVANDIISNDVNLENRTNQKLKSAIIDLFNNSQNTMN